MFLPLIDYTDTLPVDDLALISISVTLTDKTYSQDLENKTSDRYIDLKKSVVDAVS